ncbi:hypothetical protein EVAR_48871_1 [Eumeta japonica]|uniref:Uncharacterized protein n=1 Tax=Eumeta variegata TaxID=151549 RepID=A0A4C1Y4T2_EUMVA|nr:hypothetical protein EVAR_48871_1 [Eumeta japonica]
MHGSEGWIWRKENENRINAVKMRSLCNTCEVSMRDRFRNGDIREQFVLKEDRVNGAEKIVIPIPAHSDLVFALDSDPSLARDSNHGVVFDFTLSSDRDPAFDHLSITHYIDYELLSRSHPPFYLFDLEPFTPVQCRSGATDGRCHRRGDNVQDRRLNVLSDVRSVWYNVI